MEEKSSQVPWSLFPRIPECNEKGKRAILGVLEAFCRADKEQGQKSLHSHWLIWMKNFGKLEELLLHNDATTQDNTRNNHTAYINEVMSAKYGDFEVKATHT